MKPARFEYFDPATLSEAVDLLARYGGEGKVLAGGQSLLPLLYMRLATPPYLIDVTRVAGLDGVRVEPAGAGNDAASTASGATGAARGAPAGEVLCVGATARQRLVERAASVRAGWPLVSEALRWVGHAAIRSRGTFGGSVAHADPSAELPAVVAALDGELRVVGPAGERTVPADEFFLTYLTTTLAPEELLVEVRLPAPPARSGQAFVEVARRHGDFALVGLACVLALEPDGRHVAAARLAFTGVGGTPLRARAAEAALVGEVAAAALFAHAGELAQAAAEPDSDLHASADYRRHLMGVMARRGLALALERAG